jgi:hypothetical protein
MNAERCPERAVSERQCRDDRVIRALAGREFVRVALLEREQGCSILEEDARPFGAQTRPEAHIQAVDERAGVALAIHDRQIDGIRAGGGTPERRRLHRPIALNQGAALADIGLREQVFNGRGVRGMVGDVVARVGESEAHCLNHEMQTFGAVPGQGGQFEAFEQS